jgi:DNA-binding transcriptional LysR family regulator
MIEGVTIEQLRTLRAVAEAGSFAAAARKLGRVQAAVGQAMDRLEAQLGLRLFDRSGRTVRLTRQGEAIAAAAAGVQGELDALDALVGSLKQGAETSLSIAVDSLFPTPPLVDFAKEFAREHPSVELVVYTELLSAVTTLVRERRAAWGVAVEDADLTGLERRHVAFVDMVPVAARSHPLARRGTRPKERDFASAVQIVLSERRSNDSVPSRDHAVISRRQWRVVDLGAKHALIASGLGWGLMPEHLVRDDVARGALVPLHIEALGADPISRALVLVWRQGAVFGPVARWAETRLTHLCQGAVRPRAVRAPRRVK